MSYAELIATVKEANILSSVEGLLDWDSETMMPEKGLPARADQLSLMAALAHQRRTDPRVGEWLAKLDGKAADESQAANLREIRRGYDRAVKIPADLIRRIAHSSTIAKDAWGKARAEKSFAAFAPHLGTMLDLKRQVAECIGYAAEPYDALLDEYEPGMTTAQVADVFASLRGPLSNFVKRLKDAPKRPDAAVLHRRFDCAAQETFARRMADVVGFDFAAGRLDVSKHPFCSGSFPGDIRLTTRYYEDFFSPSVFGVLHEAGHGMYEQGLPIKHAFTPLGQPVSLGIHESQSRLWENFVGRSRPFWEKFYPEAQSAFSQSLKDVSLDQFHAAINVVQPSFIRVEADEVTYNLHIIVRFEMERAMINSNLAVKDVPAAWNEKMRDFFGITPPDDAHGCLQDIHWSMGAFGYFPTYALGNLYAAQLFDTAKKAIPDLDGKIRNGQLRPLLDWLRENIHRHGQHYRAADLVQRVTGKPPSIEPFLAYVREKFSPFYGL